MRTPLALANFAGNVVAAAILLAHRLGTNGAEAGKDGGEIRAAHEMVEDCIALGVLPEAVSEGDEWFVADRCGAHNEPRGDERERDRASARQAGVSKSAHIRRAAEIERSRNALAQ